MTGAEGFAYNEPADFDGIVPGWQFDPRATRRIKSVGLHELVSP
jgi:hypothetical protein